MEDVKHNIDKVFEVYEEKSKNKPCIIDESGYTNDIDEIEVGYVYEFINKARDYPTFERLSKKWNKIKGEVRYINKSEVNIFVIESDTGFNTKGKLRINKGTISRGSVCFRFIGKAPEELPKKQKKNKISASNTVDNLEKNSEGSRKFVAVPGISEEPFRDYVKETYDGLSKEPEIKSNLNNSISIPLDMFKNLISQLPDESLKVCIINEFRNITREKLEKIYIDILRGD